jgi:hypothetical protein
VKAPELVPPLRLHSRFLKTLQTLDHMRLATWVFGGWAEELRGLRSPGPHGDIDLLYPAQNFERLDAQIAAARIQEIPQKHLSHKRAIELEGIRIEFFLLEPDRDGHRTSLFDGRFVYHWPADTLACGPVPVDKYELRVASRTALADYRRVYSQCHSG